MLAHVVVTLVDVSPAREREAALRRLSETCELVVPLLLEGDVWGAINVEEIASDVFDHDDVILISTLANQVSAALRAAGLVERLETARAQIGRHAAVAGPRDSGP